NHGGSVAAKVLVPQAASYRFEVVRAVPNGAINMLGGDSILSLRSNCTAPTSQLACNDDIDANGGNLLSSFTVTLNPGTYYLVTGQSCIDTAGVLAEVSAPAVPAVYDGIDRGGPSRAGSWAAEQPTPCTVSPRIRSQNGAGVDLYDEEICVPGGAFTLGSRAY